MVSLSNHRKPFDKLRACPVLDTGANVSFFHITTTMRQCVPSANSSQSSFSQINKKTHPNGGTGRIRGATLFRHPARSRKTSVRHAGSCESRDAPGTDNGCPLRPRLHPFLKGFGWRLPGPFGLCVRTGSHLTRLSERRRRPTTPVLSQFRILLIAVYRASDARVKVFGVPVVH